MTLAVGTYGLDSASTLNYVSAHGLGSRFQLRYSAGKGNLSPNSQFKLTKPGEIASIVKAGQDFIANSEWSIDRCTQGAAAGREDGLADLAFWRVRGLNKGSSIYVSWDAAPHTAQYAAVVAYMQAYNKALGGYYVVDGLYAGIPVLVYFSQHGLIKHGWIPSAGSWSVPNEQLPPGYAPPAKTAWNLWEPTKSQVQPAMHYLLGKLAGHKLVSCIWQTGNYWLGKSADEDVILISGPLGSHLEHVPGHPVVKPPVVTPPKPAPHYGPMHGRGVPSVIARGSGQFFGNINGPRASHGGFNANERPYVKLIQQQLIFLGCVPGHANPNDGWADGIWDVRGNGQLGGPTSDAMTRFQRKYLPHTTQWGKCYWDDWTKLASM